MAGDGEVARCARMLEKYGFSESSASGMRSCFDIMSSRRGRIMILKLADNIDSLTAGEAGALNKLRGFFDAEVFVVFKNCKGRRAAGGAVYNRHGVGCTSMDTLESVLNGSEVASAQRFIRAKYRVDGGNLRRLRMLYGLSVRSLSRKLGISEDSISRYERDGADATKRNLEKLERFFDASLGEPTQGGAAGAMYRYSTANRKSGIGFIKVNAAPFYMLGKGHSRYEAGGEADARTMKKAAGFYGSMKDVLDEDYQFFAVRKRRGARRIGGIPVLERSEIENAGGEKELIDLIVSG